MSQLDQRMNRLHKIARQIKAVACKEDSQRPLLALGWMLLSAIAFSAMNLWVRELSTEYSSAEMMFHRFLFGALIVAAVMRLGRESFVPKQGKFFLVSHGIFGFLAVVCLYHTLSVLPLSIAVMLFWCSPVFMIVLSPVFVGKSVNRNGWLWSAVAFVGLTLLLRPFVELQSADSLSLTGVAIGVAGAVFSGLRFVGLRGATANLSPNLVVLYGSGISALLALPFSLGSLKVPTWEHSSGLLWIAISGIVGQVGMTKSYKHASAPLASSMTLLNVAVSSLFGAVFLGESLGADQWLGMIVVNASIAALTLATARAKERDKGRIAKAPFEETSLESPSKAA